MTSRTQKLPETLARRIQFLRESIAMHPLRLAELARISREQLDDIEAGIETFLAPAIRQRLARALRVKPGILEEVELRPKNPHPVTPESLMREEELLVAAMSNPTRTYFCPQCGESLSVKLFERRDLEDNPVIALKIRCSRCLFHLEKD